MARQGCCAWRSRGPGARDERDAEPASGITGIHAAGRGAYGAPKVFAELRRYGERTSRERVARIMREEGLSGTTRGCARGPKGGEKPAAPQANAAPGLVRRDFSADGPDEAWFAGIACVRTHQGRLYLAEVMDIWPRGTVGWSTSARMAAGLADGALKMAMARRRPPEGCVHHSDHGSRYVSLQLGRTMRGAGTVPSMGSTSSPWDNAAMELLMGPIEAEYVHARTIGTRGQAALEIFDYIECLYNRKRIRSALGHLGPEESERANRPGEGRRPMAA